MCEGSLLSYVGDAAMVFGIVFLAAMCVMVVRVSIQIERRRRTLARMEEVQAMVERAIRVAVVALSAQEG